MESLLPFLSVRDVVLFPENSLPLQIGRAFTIASIKKALEEHNGHIIVATQKAVEMTEKPTLDEVFSVGCLCQIQENINFPDGAMKILIQPRERVKIKEIKDKQGVRFCAVEKLPPYTSPLKNEQKASIWKTLEEKLKEMKSDRLKQVIKDLKQEERGYQFIMTAGHLLNWPEVLRKELSLDEINRGLFLIDTYSDREKKSINLGLARIQEVLEANDADSAIRKLRVLL